MNINLIQKEYDCPICGSRFKAPRPRMAKLTPIGQDNDLRPYYENIDIVCYEVVVCTNCGYTAHNSCFENFDPLYVERTRKGLETVKVQKTFYTEVVTEDAIDRHISAINLLAFKKAKASEFYFLYSRLAWLYRTINNADALENEFLSLKKAYMYLEEAYKKEKPPFFGMDESTTIFILGETARRIGEYDKANVYMGRSILDPKSTDELRERAKETKKMIADDMEATTKIFEEEQVAQEEQSVATKKKINGKKVKEKKVKVKKEKKPKK